MAYENLQKYKCGGCGESRIEIFGSDNEQILIAECTKCKSKTEITITAPKIKMNWGEGAEGILAQY